MSKSALLLWVSAIVIFLYATAFLVLLTALWMLSGHLATLAIGGVTALTFIGHPLDMGILYLASESGEYVWRVLFAVTAFVIAWLPLRLILTASRLSKTERKLADCAA